MSDTKVQVEVKLTSNCASGYQEMSCRECLQNTGQAGEILGISEAEEPLSLLANVALATPCVDNASCSCACEACSNVEVRGIDGSLQTMQLQLQFLMRKADDLHNSLVNSQAPVVIEFLAAAVPSFLCNCQPYFNHLEALTRSSLSQHALLPLDIYTQRMQLLDFSQQLCERLEQLVLTYASFNVLSLDETEPNSVSHFCVGQNQLGQLRLTAFLYCKPTPYLARVDTGLHKRMRWNVERLGDKGQQADVEQGGDRDNTEYYFLCCEDIPNAHARDEVDSQGVSNSDVVRIWSIGQWMQVNPDPERDHIFDWIMCEVPQASYHRLLFLGSDEPSSCSATDLMLQLLLSCHTTGGCCTLQDEYVSWSHVDTVSGIDCV